MFKQNSHHSSRARLITGRALRRLNTWFDVNFKRSSANPPAVSGLKHRADDGRAPSAAPARPFSRSFIFLWCKSIIRFGSYENVFLWGYFWCFCGFIVSFLLLTEAKHTQYNRPLNVHILTARTHQIQRKFRLNHPKRWLWWTFQSSCNKIPKNCHLWDLCGRLRPFERKITFPWHHWWL